MLIKRYNQAVYDYNNRLCRFVDKLLQNTDAAKDITQEAYLRLWENRNKVDFDKVRAWLFTTAYRLSMDYLNHNKRFDRNAEVPDKWIVQENTDLKEVIHQALKLLPEIQRSIILLKDYEGYSYAEIGEILNLNESQVKVYLFRARKKIKEYIGDLRLVI
jgi:RNA polymerase sigma factor (sigma-70 family)